MTPIDWSRLARALEFYERRGYKRVEAPWAVEDRFVELTAPYPEWRSVVPNLGSLVGSAEQAFLQLDAQQVIGKGRYVALTPCFRVAEPKVDDLHQRYFMKVELYANDGPLERALDDIMDDAYAFFQQEKPPMARLEGVVGDTGVDGCFDFEINGVEVGSYGIRRATVQDVAVLDRADLYREQRRVVGDYVPKPQFVPEGYEVTDLSNMGEPRIRIRRERELRWAYGTGVAEPRFTHACGLAVGRVRQRIGA